MRDSTTEQGLTCLMHSCMHECMKTITLTEEAYNRLREWKQSAGDSFSKVILKVVPERGTLGQMLDDVGKLPPLGKEHARVMEEAGEWGGKPDAEEKWTS